MLRILLRCRVTRQQLWWPSRSSSRLAQEFQQWCHSVFLIGDQDDSKTSALVFLSPESVGSIPRRGELIKEQVIENMIDYDRWSSSNDCRSGLFCCEWVLNNLHALHILLCRSCTTCRARREWNTIKFSCPRLIVSKDIFFLVLCSSVTLEWNYPEHEVKIGLRKQKAASIKTSCQRITAQAIQFNLLEKRIENKSRQTPYFLYIRTVHRHLLYHTVIFCWHPRIHNKKTAESFLFFGE